MEGLQLSANGQTMGRDEGVVGLGRGAKGGTEAMRLLGVRGQSEGRQTFRVRGDGMEGSR